MSHPRAGRVAATLRSRAAVLREANFRRFYLGFATSQLGSAMAGLALAFAVLEGGGGPTELGYVFAAEIVPQVAFMLAGGVIADRRGRRRVMLAADTLRLAGQATLAVALFVGTVPIWLFVVLAGAHGIGGAFFTPALTGLTVEIAPRDRLGDANALFGSPSQPRASPARHWPDCSSPSPPQQR